MASVKVDSLAERMRRRQQELADERQAKLQVKLNNGYRPGLDIHGNVVLVKVKTKGG